MHVIRLSNISIKKNKQIARVELKLIEYYNVLRATTFVHDVPLSVAVHSQKVTFRIQTIAVSLHNRQIVEQSLFNVLTLRRLSAHCNAMTTQ